MSYAEVINLIFWVNATLSISYAKTNKRSDNFSIRGNFVVLRFILSLFSLADIFTSSGPEQNCPL